MIQGLELLKLLVVQVGPIFTVDQARPVARDLGLGDAQLRWTVSELARSGWTVRLKRGVYAVQPPLVGSDLHPFAVAAALVEPLAISHWSALAHHGLTTQIPPMIQASTTRSVVTPEMRHGETLRPRGRAVWSVLDWEFEFIKIRKKGWFGFQQEWVSQWRRVHITDPERTLLDMFAHPGVFGSIGTAMATLEDALDSLELGRLVQYALRYDVGALVKRLGWTMERLGVSPSLIEPLRSLSVSNVYLLDPAGPASGPLISNWQVRNNLVLAETT